MEAKGRGSIHIIGVRTWQQWLHILALLVMPGGAAENPSGTGEEAYVTCPLGGTWRPGTARNTRVGKLHQNDKVPEKRRREIE